jgi:hypothetical protein
MFLIGAQRQPRRNLARIINWPRANFFSVIKRNYRALSPAQ